MADLMETERYYPFSEGPGEYVTEDDWAAMTEGFQDDGVYGHPGTPDLTIGPGPEPNTIQVNVGDAHVGGYHYRLTAPKVLDTVANAGTEDRSDLVVLELDLVAKTITPVLLAGVSIFDIGQNRCPLGIWKQPPSSEVTSSYWGEATDARWFSGARVRPYVESAIPPATPGSLIFNPLDPSPGSVYLGSLDGNGNPYWSPWYPIGSERMESFEAHDHTDQLTRSTSFVAGSPQVSNTFVAPPSGSVMVTVFAQLECAEPGSASCGFEIRENSSTGPVRVAARDTDAVGNQGDRWTGASRRKLVTGLTPGTTYFIRTMHRSSNASTTATIFYRSLTVEPVYTEVAPGAPTFEDINPTPDAVLTTGGSTIRVPDGDTTTQALNIKLPSGDRATAPDTFAIYVNTGTDASPVWTRTGYFNEYGELRVVPSSTSRVAMRLRMRTGQTADAFQVADIDNNPLGGFRPNGEVFAPNVGNAKVTASASPPASPSVGDLWVNLSESPPVVNVRAAGGWSALTDGGGGPVDPDPPASAPAFVDVQTTEINWTSVTVPIPAGDTVLAFLTWNTNAPLVSVPSGWELVDEVVTGSARAAVYTINAADVNSTDFTLAESAKFAVVALGYEACTVTAADGLAETTAGTVHEAPALDVQDVPATLVRFYFDKGSTTTSWTVDDPAATQRGVQYGSGGGASSALATDQVVSSAGVVPQATATTDYASAQAGGFSVALKAA